MDLFSADGLTYLFSVVKHRRRLLLIPILIGMTATVYVLKSSPTVYKSTAVILVEEQDVPKNLVQSTITSFVDQRIQLIKRKVMTRQKLAEIVETYDLYSGMRTNVPMRVVLDRFKKDVEMKTNSVEISDPRSGKNRELTLTFNISYKSKDPSVAQKIANEFATLFLNENVRSRTEVASEAASFLTTEAVSLESRIQQKETQLAAFKEKHAGSLPGDVKFNKDLLERSERDLFEADQRIQSLEDRVLYLSSELVNTDPNVTRVSKNGEVFLSPQQQLRTLESEYLNLSSRYGKRHPDLLKLEKQIATLKSTTGVTAEIDPAVGKRIFVLNKELETKQVKYGAQHPEVLSLKRRISILEADLAMKAEGSIVETNPDNPVFIQLSTQRNSAVAEIESLKQQREKTVKKIDDIQEKLILAPQVESRYSALTREYANLSSQYKEIKAHQMEAQLGESLEKGQKGDRFTMIEPPLLPLKPFSPNVRLILFVGVAGAISFALAMVALFESFDRRVYTASQLSDMLGVGLLVTISHIDTQEELAVQRERKVKYGLASVVFLAFLAIFIWVL